MKMVFTDGDDRDYKRHFDKPKIEVSKLVDPSSTGNDNDWLRIRVVSGHYDLNLQFSPDEVHSLLYSLVFSEPTKMDEAK